MLNISPQSISHKVERNRYQAFNKLENRSVSSALVKVIVIVFLICLFGMFLPWTQNIRSYGYVTALSAQDRPQEVQAIVGGRIDQWLANEGDFVMAGDTILLLSEAKDEYLDPEIQERTKAQREAKLGAAESYSQKAQQISQQITALNQNFENKLAQNELAIRQTKLKISTDSLELIAAELLVQNSDNQFKRSQELFEKGINSRTELEQKNNKLQDAIAKTQLYENKILEHRAEIENYRQKAQALEAERREKVAKLRGEIASAQSDQYTALGESDKLQSTINKLQRRQASFAVIAPINGYVTKALVTGIGELVKGGQGICTIIPAEYDLAVELYVRPRDMPLIKKGKQVRILFDGWPAIVFSGWPNNSFGTFEGQVYAIDNDISDNGLYRLLVVESNPEKPWPEELRIGGGANGLLLLNRVQVYYEIWRQLNGFPPDYYDEPIEKAKKSKAPIRKLK